MLQLFDLAGLFIVGVIVWLVTAFAIFFAARVVAGSRATYSRALGLTLVGVIVISISSILLTGFFGFMGPILVFIIWLALVKSFFHTGWLGALGIAILAVFMLLVLIVILGFALALIGIPYIRPPVSIPTYSL